MTADDFDPVSYARIEAKLQAGRERAKAERIAAVAPELLAALRALLDACEHACEHACERIDELGGDSGDWTIDLDNARAAIAAAEGRS